MVFIFGIDIPIIAFFSFVVLSISVILFFALITMIWKGGKLIREAGEVIDEEEKIHHIHLHQKKAAPAVKKGPSLFGGFNSFWESQKKVAETSWLERHNKEVAAREKQLEAYRKEEEKEIALEKAEDARKAAKQKKKKEVQTITVETWWDKHKKEIKAKEEIKETNAKKGPTLFKRWDSYWKERKKELLNPPKWTNPKPVIVKKPEPVKEVVLVNKEKKPKRKFKIFKLWNNYWKKQKRDLDEGMKPEKDNNEK